MKKIKQTAIKWLPEVQPHDFAAASSYLGLLHGSDLVRRIISRLKRAPIAQFQAKDIFRASQLSLLGVSNSHVEKDRLKIRGAQSLSPLLLLRDQQGSKVVIADGYHRLCAVYQFDEDAVIHCKIV